MHINVSQTSLVAAFCFLLMKFLLLIPQVAPPSIYIASATLAFQGEGWSQLSQLSQDQIQSFLEIQ